MHSVRPSVAPFVPALPRPLLSPGVFYLDGNDHAVFLFASVNVLNYNDWYLNVKSTWYA